MRRSHTVPAESPEGRTPDGRTPVPMIAVLAAAALLASTGCVPKSDLEEAQAELAACEEARATAEATTASWERRYDRESSRWTQLETSVSQALPRALNEFHADGERILELVPEQVKVEVEGYLEDYFNTVMRGVAELSDDNAEIKLELKATQKALDAVGADARGIRTAVDEALTDERAKRDVMAGRLGDLSGELGAVVDRVVAFDRTRINCKQCPERLRLNRKERETILAFHAELMSELSDLQSGAAAQ